MDDVIEKQASPWTIPLFIDLTTQTTVLTPNRRLAAVLQKHYQYDQRQQGKSSWPTPDILPSSSWVERLWHEYTLEDFSSTSFCLNVTQEQFLWEQIVSQSKQNNELLQVAETAYMAQSAWHLLKQWDIDHTHSLFQSTEDYRTLQHWVHQFSLRCQHHQWLDTASVIDHLCTNIQANHLPKKIALVGFNELTPQFQRFLHHCSQRGVQIKQIEPIKQNKGAHRITLPDQEAELFTMARWAKSILEKNQPRPITIGCVIPTLDQIHDRVIQIFSQVFSDNMIDAVSLDSGLFNLSMGKSLVDYPVIHAAFLGLALSTPLLSTDIISPLLCSPFFGEAEKEHCNRVQFDALLRQENVRNILLSDLLKRDALFDFKKKCPKLAKHIKAFMALLHQKMLPYSAWAQHITQLLSALGWPGERSLNSHEYQVVEDWLRLLSDYQTLDQVTSTVHFKQALRTLHQMAKKRIFQPKTPEAPIQILGLLEAAALPFDYTWVTGLDDLSWPPQPKPHPFIPKPLQREWHMPHATAERELLYCQQLTHQLIHSSKETIFSHAAQVEEIELRPSPLIRALPEKSIAQLDLLPFISVYERIYAAKHIEYLDDQQAPMRSTDHQHGGATVITLQAQCPFKAFAACRLHARKLENPIWGLRKQDRGIIIHRIMETVWQDIQNQHRLNTIPADQLEQILADCIDLALEPFARYHALSSVYFLLEKQHLKILLTDWLEKEKSRPFFKVLSREEKCDITIGSLTLSLRIDRIDELADGTKLIIDYKTGKHNDINKWFGTRPEELQLPLYCLLDDKQTTGMSIAQLTPGEACFKGVSQHALDIMGIKPLDSVKKAGASTWEEQQAKWSTIIARLSDDFVQGIATVDPKDRSQTCKQCAIKPFCRIDEEHDHHES